jgi:hypothetical protein
MLTQAPGNIQELNDSGICIRQENASSKVIADTVAGVAIATATAAVSVMPQEVVEANDVAVKKTGAGLGKAIENHNVGRAKMSQVRQHGRSTLHLYPVYTTLSFMLRMNPFRPCCAKQTHTSCVIISNLIPTNIVLLARFVPMPQVANVTSDLDESMLDIARALVHTSGDFWGFLDTARNLTNYASNSYEELPSFPRELELQTLMSEADPAIPTKDSAELDSVEMHLA